VWRINNATAAVPNAPEVSRQSAWLGECQHAILQQRAKAQDSQQHTTCRLIPNGNVNAALDGKKQIKKLLKDSPKWGGAAEGSCTDGSGAPGCAAIPPRVDVAALLFTGNHSADELHTQAWHRVTEERDTVIWGARGTRTAGMSNTVQIHSTQSYQDINVPRRGTRNAVLLSCVASFPAVTLPPCTQCGGRGSHGRRNCSSRDF